MKKRARRSPRDSAATDQQSGPQAEADHGNAFAQEQLAEQSSGEQGAFGTSFLDAALEECFGDEVAGLDVSWAADEDNAAIGADASTEGSAIRLSSAIQPNEQDPHSLAVIAEETAHALAGGGSGETVLDTEQDPGEAKAKESGQRFADWVTSGMQGEAPQLQPATGGKAAIHRHATARLSGRPILQKGSGGGDVRILQTLLNAHGAKLKVDGDFGPATHRAVVSFQRRKGLAVDGLVGPKTAAVLNKSGAKTPAPARQLTGRPMLKEGNSGVDVRTLQDLLNTHGERLGVDGQFGPKTARAVRSFQSKHGLAVDGLVGPKTVAALYNNTKKHAHEDKAPQGPQGPQGPVDMNVGDADPKGILKSGSVNPRVRNMAKETVLDLQAQGLRPYVFEGFRSFSRQNDLYEQGGVTGVRGGGSWHNYGLAIDIVFYGTNGGPSWGAPAWQWQKLGKAGKAAGFTTWGGDWGWDMPHLEYHPKWSGSAYGLASTYHSQGVGAVWKKVGAS